MNKSIEGVSTPESNQEKQKKWDEASAQVEKIVDGRGKGIDEGIKGAIIAFMVLGFKTAGSCEGHLDWGVASPWIDIISISREQKDELIKKIREINIEIEKEEDIDKTSEKLMELYEQHRILESERDNLSLPKIKEVADLLAEFYQNRSTDFYSRIIMEISSWYTRIMCQGAELQNIADPDQKASSLKEYQNEFKEFTEFIKNKYFEI